MSSQGYKTIVKRRLTVLMLTAAFVLAGVVSPCVGQQRSCAMPWVGQMDCCKAKAGISAPPCCSGKQQVDRDIAVSRERPAGNTLAVLAVHVLPVVAFADPKRIGAVERIEACTAPPGGTLVAQHTSLLL